MPKKKADDVISVTALKNLLRINDDDKLVDLLLDENIGFFSIFESKIQGLNSREITVTILKLFKVLFATIVDFDDEKRKKILWSAFTAHYLKSDIRYYFEFLENNAKKVVKEEHIDALKGYYYYLHSLDKNFFREVEVRTFLEHEYKLFDHVLYTIEENTDQEIFIEEPKPRLCQRPIGTGIVETEDETGSIVKHRYNFDYRNMSIFPTHKDIHRTENPVLRKNLVEMSYMNVDHYLDTQFRLLREILVRPLHESIQKLKLLISKRKLGKEKDDENLDKMIGVYDNERDLLVYQDIQLIESVICNCGMVFKASFDVSNLKNVEWEESKRLLPGSILCMSHNDFETFFFVIITDRQNAEKGEISLMLIIQAEDEESFVDLFTLIGSKKYTAVESVTYFEAYRYSLQCLKDFNWKMEFPFKEYIVDVSMNSKSPAYLEKGTIYDLSSSARYLRKDVRAEFEDNIKRLIRSSQLTEVDITKPMTEIPWDLMDMDQSQFEAFHAALTREFVVIQGPPGTGKTYTALRIVQALLDNRKQWCGTDKPEFSCPILILSYKNHALDQFLEGISRFTLDKHIVRVGGNTKSECMKQLSLTARRQAWRENPANFQKIPEREKKRYGFCKAEIRRTLQKIDEIGRSYKQVRLGYIIAGLEILKYIKESGFSIVHQFFSPKDIGNADEMSKSIMKWLGIDEYVPVDDYRRIGLELINLSIRESVQSETKSKNDNEEDIEDDDDYEETDNCGKPTVKHLLDQRQIDPEEYEEDEQFKGQTYNKGLFAEVDLEKMAAKAPTEQRKRAFQAALKIRDYLRSNDCMTDDEVEEISNIKKLVLKDRWRLYRYWLSKYFEDVKKQFEIFNRNIVSLHQELQNLKLRIDHTICKDVLVVGMTTTGAAKHRKLVELMKPKILIVEEAAEILEAHVVSILTSSTQHLIMIGDHKQLRPIPGIQELAVDYNMEISLFERMVMNGMTCFQLQNQHRMRPVISSLLKPHIYEILNDHPSVTRFDNVGFTFGKNLFFINHNVEESKRSFRLGYSSANVHEAHFVVELARYFILKGVEPKKITILTTYNAQLDIIKSRMLWEYRNEFVEWPKKKKDEAKGGEKKPKPMFKVRVSTVDGFQGEENDIIIISFVRSNTKGDIGFLRIPNRVCVALSRARKGLFCIGNFDEMKKNSELWKNIIKTVEENKCIGNAIKLGCKCKSKSFEKPEALKMFNGLMSFTKCSCKG